MGKKIKKVRKERYFGTVVIKPTEKVCWVAKEFQKGWALGFATGKRTVWLTGLRFASKKEISRMLGKISVVFVELKNNQS